MCYTSMFGQKQLFTEVQFEKPSVFVGEPLELSVSVYTATWFTKGVSPGNVKVNGAFTVYFRSLSTSKEVDGQLYSGVKLFFNVFPYEAKDLVFPSLEFSVETPDIGDYKGKKRKIRTRERVIKVKDVPQGVSKNNWLVSTSVSVYDQWKGNLKKVKVGDVLERSIRLNVSGTVSKFIPVVVWDSIAHVSIYPKRAVLKNNQTKTAISASRVEGVRYLFEREGSIVIPEIIVHWWHPRHKKLYKKTLKSHIINVLSNPNLGMLETARASLDKNSEDSLESSEDFLILGMRPIKFILFLFSFLIAVVFLVFTGANLFKKYIRAREVYRNSEGYYFKMFMRSLGSRTSTDSVNKCYAWLGRLNLKTPTVSYFFQEYGTLQNENNSMDIQNCMNDEFEILIPIKEWKKARKRYFDKKYKPKKPELKSLNP